MMSNSTPIRPTLAEICAAAMVEAADAIEAACDAATFLAALGYNHRLWLAVRGLADQQDWPLPSPRDVHFAIRRSARLGRGLADADIEALVAINHHAAEELAGGGDMAGIRSRVRLAYRRRGRGDGFLAWLLGRIGPRGRGMSRPVPAVEPAAIAIPAPA